MEDPKQPGMILYFFSGTGNARHIARWIEYCTVKAGRQAEVVDISKMERRRNLSAPNVSMIGFISPTHGFNMPPIMFHFILRFPKGNGQQVFIINTRAGMKAGKRFIPGLSGMAQYFSALILWMKGYKIMVMHSIDLPSNWISLHPGLKTKVVNSIYARRKKETEDLADRLIRGKNDYRALKDIIQDLLITPIGILYYLFGRFFLAKTFIASGACNDCSLCLKQCPVSAIKKVDKRMFWTYRCESCMKCMNNCPQRAIETAHGFVAGIIFLTYGVVLYFVYQYFPITKILQSLLPAWLTRISASLFNTLFIFLLLFAGYSIMHYLMRFKTFERIVTYTSLTKYKFWRRYKAPKK